MNWMPVFWQRSVWCKQTIYSSIFLVNWENGIFKMQSSLLNVSLMCLLPRNGIQMFWEYLMMLLDSIMCLMQCVAQKNHNKRSEWDKLIHVKKLSIKNKNTLPVLKSVSGEQNDYNFIIFTFLIVFLTINVASSCFAYDYAGLNRDRFLVHKNTWM